MRGGPSRRILPLKLQSSILFPFFNFSPTRQLSLYLLLMRKRKLCHPLTFFFFLRIKYHTIFFIPLLLINIFYNLFAQYLAPREIFLYLSALEWFSIGPRVPRNSKYYIFNNDKNTRNLYASYGYLINNKILQ